MRSVRARREEIEESEQVVYPQQLGAWRLSHTGASKINLFDTAPAVSLVQPKARPISPRGRRLPQPRVCPDLVDAAGFTSRAISPPHALKLLAYSSGLSNSTWACIRRSSSCFA